MLFWTQPQDYETCALPTELTKPSPTLLIVARPLQFFKRPARCLDFFYRRDIDFLSPRYRFFHRRDINFSSPRYRFFHRRDIDIGRVFAALRRRARISASRRRARISASRRRRAQISSIVPRRARISSIALRRARISSIVPPGAIFKRRAATGRKFQASRRHRARFSSIAPPPGAIFKHRAADEHKFQASRRDFFKRPA